MGLVLSLPCFPSLDAPPRNNRRLSEDYSRAFTVSKFDPNRPPEEELEANARADAAGRAKLVEDIREPPSPKFKAHPRMPTEPKPAPPPCPRRDRVIRILRTIATIISP